jgi:hypothetical protein
MSQRLLSGGLRKREHKLQTWCEEGLAGQQYRGRYRRVFVNIAGDYAIFNKERPAGTVERA